jgi:hypothetical protein
LGELVTLTPADTQALLRLVDELRERGAVRVRVGEVEVQFAAPKPRPPVAAEPAETPAQRAKREAAEYEEMLLWSAEAGA